MEFTSKLKKITALISSICILSACFGHAVVAEEKVNLALQCDTKISGSYSAAHIGANAVDGNINTIWASGSVGGDYGIEKNSIVVDLDDMYNISEVNVRTRRDMDTNWDRYGWLVYISQTSDFENAVLIGKKPTMGKFKEDLEIKLEQPVTGRYIKVISADRGISVSEIEVFGDIVKSENSISEFKDIEMSDAVILVSFLNILSGQTSTEFSPGRLIKRAEAADIALKLINVGATGANNPYSDLTDEHLYYNAITTANSMGIISTAQCFNPDNYVTVTEFAAMILRALGVYYETNTQYPDSVLKCAMEHELFDDIELGVNDYLNKENAAIILYNALKIYPYEKEYNPSSYGGVEYTKSKSTVLEKYHGMKLVEGVITVNNATTLVNKEETNYIRIDSEQYIDNSKSLYQHIGKSVKALVDIESDKEIYVGWESSKNNIIKISSDDIVEVSRSKVEYINTENKRKNIKINEAYILKNGVSYTEHSYTKETICSAGSELVFIDNDDDGIVDVIDIKEPLYISNASFVYDESGEIRITDTNGTNCTIKDWDNLVVRIDSVPAKVKNLVGAKIIAVYITEGNKNVEIDGYVNCYSGVVESKSDNEIVINGNTYKISEYFTSNAEKMGSCEIGDTIDYFINSYNRIVWVGKTTSKFSSVEHYGVITNLYFKSLFDASFKIFSDAGTFDTYKIDGECVVDGEKLDCEEIVSKGGDYYLGKMVVFRSDVDKNLTYLDTENYNSAVEANSEMKHHKITGTDIKMYYGNVYEGLTQLLSTKKDMMVFEIPYINGKIYKGDLFDSYYAVSTRSEAFGNSTKLNSDDKFYCIDDNGFAQIGIRAVSVPYTDRTYIPSKSENSPLVIVSEIVKGINNDDEVVYEVKGYNISEGSYIEASVVAGVTKAVEIINVPSEYLQDIKLVKYTAELDDTCLVSFDNINSGDVLRCDITTDKIITGVDRVFNSGSEDSQQNLYGQNAGGANSSGWVSSFDLIKVEDGYIYLNMSSGQNKFDYTDFARLYVVEGRNIQTKTAAQIPSYVGPGSHGMIYIKGGKPSIIITYVK